MTTTMMMMMKGMRSEEGENILQLEQFAIFARDMTKTVAEREKILCRDRVTYSRMYR